MLSTAAGIAAAIACVALAHAAAVPAAAAAPTGSLLGRSLAEANETAAEVMIELYDEDASGVLSEHELEEMMVAIGVAVLHEEHEDQQRRAWRPSRVRRAAATAVLAAAAVHTSFTRAEDDHDHSGGSDVPCPTPEQVMDEYDADSSDSLDAAELEPALADLSVALAHRCVLVPATVCGTQPSVGAAFGYALAASVGVSLLGLAGVAILPLDPEKPENAKRMNALIAFAIGALLGDVMLHILPAILGVHDHDNGGEAVHAGPIAGADVHDDHAHEDQVLPAYVGPSLLVLLGVVIFYLAEVAVHRIVIAADHARSPPLPKGGHAVEDSVAGLAEPDAVRVISEHDAHHVHFSHSHVKPVGWLNLIADGFHNFTDGLALGGAFSVSVPLGLATLTAVIFHELPQELGDFAILLKSGFSRQEALKLNMISASLAILGSVIGVAVSSAGATSSMYILAFVTGSFLYIALCSMLPEVLHDTDVISVVTNVSAIMLGVAVMVLILAFAEVEASC